MRIEFELKSFGHGRSEHNVEISINFYVSIFYILSQFSIYLCIDIKTL